MGIKKKSVRGLLVDPVPNSPNLFHMNCSADSNGELLMSKTVSNRLLSKPLNLDMT